MSKCDAKDCLTCQPILAAEKAQRAAEREENRRSKAAYERKKAALETLRGYQEVTEARNRGRMVAVIPNEHGLDVKDVTEEIVSVLDALTHTLDWGSGFFDDDDLRAFYTLTDLLKFDLEPPVTK
jgi:hypothetical protein